MRQASLFLAAVAAGLIGATAASAQSETATAGLTVEGAAITITSIRPLTFKISEENADSAASMVGSPAILEISGDPGRTYRIHVPDALVTTDSDEVVEHLTILSQTAGDVSKTLTGRMDAQGRDRLYIGGLLRRITGRTSAPVIAIVPVSLDYE